MKLYMFGYNESLKGEKNALSFHGVCTFSRMGRKYGVISYLINYCTEIDCL